MFNKIRNTSSKVKLLIIDKLSMVSSDLWIDIDSGLGEIFMMNPEKELAGRRLACFNYLQSELKESNDKIQITVNKH